LSSFRGILFRTRIQLRQGGPLRVFDIAEVASFFNEEDSGGPPAN